MSGSPAADLTVVGGGIIGLSVAWACARRGMEVTVLDERRPGAAWEVAAGMLAPVSEAQFGEAGAALTRLGLRAAARWAAFASELEQAAGAPVGWRPAGTLVVARDDDDARALERELAHRLALGLEARRLVGSAARRLEPALAPGVRLAVEAPGDHSVDPRAVVGALERATARCGVRSVRGRAVGVLRSRGAVTGVAVEGAEELRARCTVVAAGSWSGALAGLAPGETVPVRPVKGQIMRLRDPAGAGLVERVLRFEGGYLVPRAEGTYVLGASMEERGFDTTVTAGAVRELLRRAWEVVPGLEEMVIEEQAAGLRPGSPDNLPIVGEGAAEGLAWATGHHRNGVLLAPVTADALAGRLAAGESDELLEACAPGRFAARGAQRRAPAAGARA